MKTLAVITGPTGSGKTALAVSLAEVLDTEIVSADSRQMFIGLPIGTAVPSAEERARVRHHLVEFLPLDAYYSAARFEQDALDILDGIWRRRDTAVLCGGSMMYVDAVTRGIDELPTISDQVRDGVRHLLETGGLAAIVERLRLLDPDYLAEADTANTRRMVHALEICIMAGRPYSELRTGASKERPFRTVKMAINFSREELFERINRRVDLMIEAGLEAEADLHYGERRLNALNTVGYKELFAMREGRLTRSEAIARIAKNTRVYAKKQMLWLRKDPSVVLLDPSRPLLPQALEALKL